MVSYTRTAKAFHWIMAILIGGLLVLGLYMQDLPLSPQKLELYSWHKWFGVTVFILVWFRLAWRRSHRPPDLSESLSPRLRYAAHVGHTLLYVLMILIPLSGWLMSSAKGFQTVWFGLVPIPDLIGKSRALGDLLQQVHKALNIILMLTLTGHILAAMWHHFVLKDDTLRRMR
ncbi:MAG: cytochrome b [Burkholderiaceae bacterium]|nr:cytochrome b [Burkholderiaceae bacterium]